MTTATSINVPADIRHPKYARAYAHGFQAAREGKTLAFVAPKYRWAISRGWKAGEGARKFDAFVANKREEFAIA